MKRYCAVFFAFVLMLLGGCKGSQPCDTVTTTAPDSEKATLKAYIQQKSIDATADDRGFYYHISTSGSGDKPTACSNVKVNYVGTLTDGTIFDQATGVSFDLSGLITGWQEGIPLVAKGGSITLYLPPSLGYGAYASGKIPANSIIIFKIDLISF